MFYEGYDLYSRSFLVTPGNTVTVARLVKQDGLGGAQNVAATTDNPVGVAMEEYFPVGTPRAIPTAYPTRDGVRVRQKGTAPIESAGPIKWGDKVTFDAQGRALASTSASDKIIGEAFTAVTGEGQLCWVSINF